MGFKWVIGFALVTLFLPLSSTATVSRAATKIVGGPEHWKFGVNYTDWSLKNAPFYINDTLVFKYDPPSNITFPHSVHLLKNRANFINCKLDHAKLVANTTQGGGSGFKFVLKKRKKPYYFACGEHSGSHCNFGLMKFSVFPRQPPCES